ncbi:MAG: TraR/DksA C4-type zinc finger protein [Planctomycetia bacterium]|nr:TraR/DksA C4-type zinc finger protein [Planctomycetia bacterium]
MNEETAEYRKIECVDCGWSDMLDTEGVRQWLVRERKIAAHRDVDDDVVYELFHALFSTFRCPDCFSTRLTLEIVEDDFRDLDARRCRGCRNVIPARRLEIVPGAQYCVSCEEKRERGEALPIRAEYCPVCGSMMTLEKTLVGTKTYYEWRCPKIPPCRYKKK